MNSSYKPALSVFVISFLLTAVGFARQASATHTSETGQKQVITNLLQQLSSVRTPGPSEISPDGRTLTWNQTTPSDSKTRIVSIPTANKPHSHAAKAI
jgi:hypothetical protein